MSQIDPFNELVDPSTPTDAGAPIRRRDLREPSTRRSRKAARERAMATQAALKNDSKPAPSGRRSAAPTKPAAKPGKSSTAKSSAASSKSAKAAKPLGKRIASRIFAGGALTLVVAYAAVQVLGLLAPTNPTTSAAAATSKVQTATPMQAGQTLTASGSAQTDVSREGFAATSVQAYGKIQDLADAAGYTVNNSGAIRWPFDSPVPLGDLFGNRIAPCSGCSTFHNGTDFETGDMAPVYAVADGTVTISGIDGDIGETVSIDHNVKGYAFTSLYGHMSAGSLKVSVGDTVHKGELVGYTGSTGLSTGPHLFFEVDIDGTPVDSFKWLKKHTAS